VVKTFTKNPEKLSFYFRVENEGESAINIRLLKDTGNFIFNRDKYDRLDSNKGFDNWLKFPEGSNLKAEQIAFRILFDDKSGKNGYFNSWEGTGGVSQKYSVPHTRPIS